MWYVMQRLFYILFPRMFYLIDYVDEVPNVRSFLRRAKLIFSFLKEMQKIFCDCYLDKLAYF